MSKRGPNTCYVALREVRLFSNSSQAKSGSPPPPPPSSLFLLRLLDSLMIVNVLTKFEKNLSTGFFFFKGMTLNFEIISWLNIFLYGMLFILIIVCCINC